jgi:hypothetical protein
MITITHETNDKDYKIVLFSLILLRVTLVSISVYMFCMIGR